MASSAEDLKKLVDAKQSYECQLFNPTNFTISIGNFSFPVHKDLITEKAGFFKTMCSSQFKEAEAHEVTLHDDSPIQVARMICAMYYSVYQIDHCATIGVGTLTLERNLKAAFRVKLGNEVDDLLKLEKETTDPVSLHLELYLMADKYDCTYLRERCISCTFGLSGCARDPARLWLVLGFIKDTTIDTKPLKDRMCAYLEETVSNYVEDPRLQDLIRDLPDLGVDLLAGLAKRNREQNEEVQRLKASAAQQFRGLARGFGR